MNKELEKRMYFFVPYNISPIQQAIQAGHAALQYARVNFNSLEYMDFVDNWKTWIILNGGTTNNGHDEDGVFLGSLNQIADQLDIFTNVSVARFYEPDLNDALTAVCFICDERVFDYEKYPDFKEYFIVESSFAHVSFADDRRLSYDELKQKHPGAFIEWTKTLGSGDIGIGKKNVFLRELLKGKKLA